MRKILLGFLIILLIFVTNCEKNFEKINEIEIDNGERLIKIKAEIADDDEERSKGLMFRNALGENEGMLFIFDDAEQRSFWMKNTLIPLDMIFIDENFEIINIESAAPCREEPCRIYKSSKPAKYVLEVNGNFTAKNYIKAGSRITAKN